VTSTTGRHDRAERFRDALAAMGRVDETELVSATDRLLAVRCWAEPNTMSSSATS